jgi:hypothetical protein
VADQLVGTVYEMDDHASSKVALHRRLIPATPLRPSSRQ